MSIEELEEILMLLIGPFLLSDSIIQMAKRLLSVVKLTWRRKACFRRRRRSSNLQVLSISCYYPWRTVILYWLCIPISSRFMPRGLLLPYHVVGRALFLVFIVHVPCSVIYLTSIKCLNIREYMIREPMILLDQKNSWTAFKLDKWSWCILYIPIT
jgi:hypothetical protein